MIESQIISISKKDDKQLIEQIKSIAEKENRSISDIILTFVKEGYAEYTTRKVDESKPLSVVSLFAGAGGLDVGLEMAGFEVIWANEKDTEACDTYIANHPRTFVERGDIRNVTTFPKADMLVGGYPCQGFSLAGSRLVTDDRNFLYKEFLRALRKIRPKFFIAENVKGLLTAGGGKIVEAMVEEYKEEGYVVDYHLVNAKDYGVPQDRERVFIIGIRNDIDFTYHLPLPTHGYGLGLKPYTTLRDAIGHLKPSEIGEYDQSGFSSRYLSRNRKRNWTDVSFCIQASGRHAPLHPSGDPMINVGKDEWILPDTSEHRKLSYVECALIQTFPPNYIWKGSTASTFKQIGNAVPCLLAKAIAKPIANYLQSKLNSQADKEVVVITEENTLKDSNKKNVIHRKGKTNPRSRGKSAASKNKIRRRNTISRIVNKQKKVRKKGKIKIMN